MLIRTQILESGDLQMDAYTFDPEEFSALEETLSAVGSTTSYEPLPADSVNRRGQRYLCRASELSRLEAILEGRFESSGLFSPLAGTGRNYKCKEVNLSGGGAGCEDIIAPTTSIARTKCLLIAHRNKWSGGVSSPGQCP